jgi:nitrite reductase/ring-hydroxylating ferredoxin subunit/uncharacterized membrane protein
MQESPKETMYDRVDPVVKSVPGMQDLAVQVKDAIHNAVLRGGDQARAVTDLLHGIPLGHPLHSLLTDIPIGAWTLSAFFDFLSLLMPFHRRFRHTADDLTRLGVIAAVPTAAAGLADFSAIKQDAAQYGLLHALMNTVGLALYILSWRARSRDQRAAGIAFSMLGMGILTVSAWLGGEMVYRLRVGVDHSPRPDEPETWKAVLPSSDLVEGKPQRVDVAGNPVLLYREGDAVYAIGAVCAHAGGPLEEGKFYDGCVQCPWHDSVYDLRTGHVVHGPSVYHQPAYDVRQSSGQIRVRVRQETS